MAVSIDVEMKSRFLRVRSVLTGLAMLLLGAAVLVGMACGASSEAEQLSLEDAVGQMLMIGVRGTEVDEELGAWLKEIAPAL